MVLYIDNLVLNMDHQRTKINSVESLVDLGLRSSVYLSKNIVELAARNDIEIELLRSILASSRLIGNTNFGIH